MILLRQKRKHTSAGWRQVQAYALFPGAKVFLIPEIEDVDRLVCRQAEVFPAHIDRRWPGLVKVEKTNHIVIAAKVINFEIPNALVAFRLEQVHRHYVDGRIHPSQQLNALC